MKLFQSLASIEAVQISSHDPVKKPTKYCEVCKNPIPSRNGQAKTCGPVCSETRREQIERSRRYKKPRSQA